MQKISLKLLAILISLLLHAVIAGLLMLMHLSFVEPPVPQKEITLVPVGVLEQGPAASSGISQVDPAAGTYTPPAAPQPPTPTKPTPQPEQQPLLQQKVPSPVATPTNVPVPRDKKLRKDPKQKASTTQADRPQPTDAHIGDKVSDAFGKSKAKGTSGKGTSTPGAGGSSYSGWSLEGRSIVGNGGKPVAPSGVPDIRGTVNVRIIVDASGTVIEARQLLKGTNITDTRIIQAAIKAARNTRFNPVPGAPDQQGTITYHFQVE